MKNSPFVIVTLLVGLAPFAMAQEPTDTPSRKAPARNIEASAPRQSAPAAREPQRTFQPVVQRDARVASPTYRDAAQGARVYRQSPSASGAYNSRRFNPTAEQPDRQVIRRTMPGLTQPADEAPRVRVSPTGRPFQTVTTRNGRNRLDRNHIYNPTGTASGVLDGQASLSGTRGNGRVRGNNPRNGNTSGGTRDGNGGVRNYTDVWRNYHHDHHDRNWWCDHHDRIILISGGYYYWDAGYWFPAWGYDSAYSNYAFDGPIYSGYEDVAPDDVISSVQTALQEEGYYRGVVDGELGPMTRAALAGWQRDHGLAITTVIDEPTMQSLGL